MVWKGLTDAGDRRFVWTVVGLVVAGWLLVALLPLLSFSTPLFDVNTPEQVEQVKSVLQQFGTYGDMFGFLNCLFSGLALIGVAYAVILQSRDLHNQQEEMGRNARASELQNRLAAYQSLANHHRDRRDTAGRDILLAARSRGRETAYAELMKLVLLEIEGQQVEHPYGDHPARVRNLRNRYEEDRDLVANPDDSFGPVQGHLLDLVEEIAALTELVRNNARVDQLLLEAGHAVNGAVDPGPAMDQPEAARAGACVSDRRCEHGISERCRGREGARLRNSVNGIS